MILHHSPCTDNFFFREERANILSESTKKSEGGEEAEPTSFEDIGRIIGQRWRAIDPEELSKYKEMAKKDSDRYRDEMKSFYNDELTLMCLGHNNEGAAAAGAGGNPDQVNVNAGQPHDAASAAAAAAAHPNGGRMGESQQMANLLQQQQQQQQQAMMNDLALRQDLMVMLAQERARAGPAAINPYQGQLPPMNVASNSFDPMGTGGASLGSNSVMNEDQILQLLMLQQQQQQVATASGQQAPPNEAFLKIVLSQKNAIQERLEKLEHEAKTLHIKRAILDKIVSKELGPGAQSEQSYDPGLDAENLSVEELFQLLQQQAAQAPASVLGVSNSPSAVGTTQPPPGGNPMGAGGPSMQELLLRQQQAAAPPPAQMNNIHPSYLAQFMAAQAPPQQYQQMFDLNGVGGMNCLPQGMNGLPQGMNGLPQGMNVGMMPNGGAPGAAPGTGGNGVSAEDMIKKLMAEQSSQGASR